MEKSKKIFRANEEKHSEKSQNLSIVNNLLNYFFEGTYEHSALGNYFEWKT